MIQLHPPLKSVRHQRFGITKRVDTLTWESVLKYGLSQGFGNTSSPSQEVYKSIGLIGHNGYDIVLYTGDPVYASHDGVIFAGTGTDTKGGIGVVIWNKEEKYKTIYWHHLTNIVKIGDIVKRGDMIAYGDNTGYSTGSHIHWGLKLTDDKGQTLNWNNGYFGAIDPTPYLHDKENNNMNTEQTFLIRFEGHNEVYDEVLPGMLEHIETGITLEHIRNGREVKTLSAKQMNNFKKIGVRAHFQPTSL